MTEIFTQPPAGGPPSVAPRPEGSTDKKLTILIGFSVVFLLAAVGVLGWVLVSSSGEGVVVAAEQGNDTSGSQKASLEGPTKPDDDPDAGGADATVAEAPDIGAAPVAVTPERINVSFQRPAVHSIVCTGEPLAYSGEQLIDGDENFGWGASMGDAAGATADMQFSGPVKLATVGLTPGYTRLAPRSKAGCQTVVAFPYQRFVQAVRWTFDDGSSVEQSFDQRPEMQTKPVDVTTSSVKLTILSTARPAGADDETVISEAAFTGTP